MKMDGQNAVGQSGKNIKMAPRKRLSSGQMFSKSVVDEHHLKNISQTGLRRHETFAVKESFHKVVSQMSQSSKQSSDLNKSKTLARNKTLRKKSTLVASRSKNALSRSQTQFNMAPKRKPQDQLSETTLKDAADKLKIAVENKRAKKIYHELMAVKSQEDPHPDLVEGIFYLQKKTAQDKWFKCKISEQACDHLTDKIVIFDRRSVYLFDHRSSFRKFIVALTHTNLFEALIVLAIFLNSIVLAITDYSDRDNETEYNQSLEQIGMVFSYIFTLELVLKVIAFGFIMHPKSYMRDTWNWLDFVVVVTGLIELSMGSKGAESVRSLRVLRVLRPLKSIHALPQMRRLISALLSSLPNLGNAVFFMLFIFLLFGILGTQQFSGSMYQRCRFTDVPNEDGSWPIDESIASLCSVDSMSLFQCPEDRYCHAPADASLNAQTVDDLINEELIDYGITVFDNLGFGLLTVFQFITLEGWSKVMYNLMDSNIAWMAVIFSIFLIMIGAFFLLNVILAVLVQALDNVEEVKYAADAKHNAFIHQSLNRRRKQEAKSAPLEPEQANQSRQMFSDLDQQENLIGKNIHKSLPILPIAFLSSHNRVQNDESSRGAQVDLGSNQLAFPPSNGLGFTPMLLSPALSSPSIGMSVASPGAIGSVNIECDKQEGYEDADSFTLRMDQYSQLKMPEIKENCTAVDKEIANVNILKASEKMGEGLCMPQSTPISLIPPIIEQSSEDSVKEKQIQQDLGEVNTSQPNASPMVFPPEIKTVNPVNLHLNGVTASISRNPLFEPSKESNMSSGRRRQTFSTGSYSRSITKFFLKGIILPERVQKNCLYKFCYLISTHVLFTIFITLLIVLNTIVLAFDSYPVNEERQKVANDINDVIIWLFFAEMIIKLLGMGFKDYARDTFNLFDALLVIVSLIDFVLLNIPEISQNGSGGALSAFRGIRLLRVFKLARSWKSFRELLHTIFLTVKEITTFSILLLICMLIFTLLGMELFGHRVFFDEFDRVVDLDTDAAVSVELLPPRPNFDTFYMSLTSIFIVFIGEDWQSIMHMHYRVQGGVPLIFFIVTYVFFHLILLNLLLAILLQNFQISDEDDKNDTEQKTFTKMRRLCRRCCAKCIKTPQVRPGDDVAEFTNSNELMSDSMLEEEEEEEEEESSSNSELQQSREKQQQQQQEQQRPQKPQQSSNEQLSSISSQMKEDSKSSSGLQESVIDDSSFQQPDYPEVKGVTSTAAAAAAALDAAGPLIDLNLQVIEADKESMEESVDLTDREDHQDKQLESGREEADTFREMLPKVITEEKQEEGKDNSQDNLAKRGPALEFLPYIGPVLAEKKNEEEKNKSDCSSDYNPFAEDANRMVQNSSNNSHLKKMRLKKQATLRRQFSTRTWKASEILKMRKQSLIANSSIAMSLAKLKMIEHFEEQDQNSKRKRLLTGKSLGIFSASNRLRKICKRIVEFKYYDMIVMMLIVISTLLLMLDNPLNDEDSVMAQWLARIDIVITIAFFFESIINIIFLGFLFNGPDSYLKDSWNVLDFVIVVFSLVSIVSTSFNLEVMKIFRMMRVLRPLRMLKRNFGLKIQVVSLLNSIPGIANLLAITMLLLMLFGIQGVNFFAGKLFYCNMENIPYHVHVKIISEWDCYDYGGEWLQYDTHFDSVGRAMLSMFIMMTTEGWNAIMWLAIDATEIHQVPERNYRPEYILFFIVFMIFGFLFILNLFVGVVLNRFDLEKDKLSHNNELTKLQHEYLEVMKNCYLMQPQRFNRKSGNRLRDLCMDIASSKCFNRFIFFCIILNSICLSITWYEEPETLVIVMEVVNIVFTVIYTVEMLIKMIAYKKNYFHDGWNVFDFLIVVSAWVGFIAFHVFSINVKSLSTVIRAFRILRVLKLIQKARNLQKILNTFLLAIPELANVGALLFLFLFLFSVLGVFLFSGVKLQNELNVHANFQNFGTALLTLFRVVTGENWQQIMFDCARQRSILFQCTEDQTYDEQQKDGINGCGTPYAYLYFVCFMLVVSLIFLNLFIAIILEGQLQATQQQEARVTDSTRALFNKKWTKYDENATGMIKIDDLIELIMDLIEEELVQIDKQQGEDHNSYVMFNFSQKTYLKIMTKVKRDLALDGQEQKLKDEPNLMRPIEWSCKKYIGQLQLPIYDKVQFFNYHDCLAAFAKQVFSDTHRKEYEERQKRIKDAEEAGTEDKLRKIDQIRRGDVDYEALNLINQEMFLQADDPDFQTVINRLENKHQDSDSSIKILKLSEVRNLRKKCGEKIKASMMLGYNNELVLDSSHLIGVEVIKKFMKQRKEKAEKRLALREERLQKIQEGESKRIKFAASMKKPEYKSHNHLLAYNPRKESNNSLVTQEKKSAVSKQEEQDSQQSQAVEKTESRLPEIGISPSPTNKLNELGKLLDQTLNISLQMSEPQQSDSQIQRVEVIQHSDETSSKELSQIVEKNEEQNWNTPQTNKESEDKNLPVKNWPNEIIDVQPVQDQHAAQTARELYQKKEGIAMTLDTLQKIQPPGLSLVPKVTDTSIEQKSSLKKSKSKDQKSQREPSHRVSIKTELVKNMSKKSLDNFDVVEMQEMKKMDVSSNKVQKQPQQQILSQVQITQPVVVEDSKFMLSSQSEDLSHSINSDTMKKDNDLFSMNLDVDATNALRKFGTNIETNEDDKQIDELGQDVDQAFKRDAKRYDSSMIIEEPKNQKSSKKITVQQVDIDGGSSGRDGGLPKSSTFRSYNFQPAVSLKSESEEQFSILYNRANSIKRRAMIHTAQKSHASKDSKGGEAASQHKKTVSLDKSLQNAYKRYDSHREKLINSLNEGLAAQLQVMYPSEEVYKLQLVHRSQSMPKIKEQKSVDAITPSKQNGLRQVKSSERLLSPYTYVVQKPSLKRRPTTHRSKAMNQKKKQQAALLQQKQAAYATISLANMFQAMTIEETPLLSLKHKLSKNMTNSKTIAAQTKPTRLQTAKGRHANRNLKSEERKAAILSAYKPEFNAMMTTKKLLRTKSKQPPTTKS